MAEQQYVVFKLGKEEYGIDIMNVKEIGPYQESVKVPNTPDFIEGIINFRGKVIPIVNLGKRFNLKDNGITNDTRIIIINLKDKQVGFVVDVDLGGHKRARLLLLFLSRVLSRSLCAHVLSPPMSRRSTNCP